jgi:hypothetical protein
LPKPWSGCKWVGQNECEREQTNRYWLGFKSEKRQNREWQKNRFYVVREPEWTVVVDMDKEFVALEVRTQKGEFSKPEFISPPNPVREMIDPQEYQGTRYWVI